MDDSYYYYLFGMRCLEGKDYFKALHYFERSLELDVHGKTYARIYECHKKLGNHLLGRKSIEEAYKLSPNNDKISMQYIRELYEEGNTESALTLLKDILKRNPIYGPAKKLLEEITGDAQY